MRKIVRRGVVNAIEHIEGECHVVVAYKPRPEESDADWILHRVGCTEEEAESFHEGLRVVLNLERELS